MLRIDVITIFPGMFPGVIHESIVGRAVTGGFLDVRLHDLRGYTHDRHRTVDDTPYGGGPGMVMKCEPLAEALDDLRREDQELIFLTPEGETFTQRTAEELSQKKAVLMLAAHYEGIDERIVELYNPRRISLGNFVLTGGELPALVVIDAVARLIPGVLGDPESLASESFNGEEGLLDHPHYTRPENFRGLMVPEVLRSGNHAAIEKWRREKREERTHKLRPDLLYENKR